MTPVLIWDYRIFAFIRFHRNQRKGFSSGESNVFSPGKTWLVVTAPVEKIFRAAANSLRADNKGNAAGAKLQKQGKPLSERRMITRKFLTHTRQLSNCALRQPLKFFDME